MYARVYTSTHTCSDGNVFIQVGFTVIKKQNDKLPQPRSPALFELLRKTQWLPSNTIITKPNCERMTKFTYSAQTLSVTLCMYCLCVCTHTLPWGTHTHTNANTRSCIHVRTHPYSLSANTLREERKSRFGSVRENHLRISFGFFLRTSSSFSLFFFNTDPNLAQNIVQPVNIGRRCG